MDEKILKILMQMQDQIQKIDNRFDSLENEVKSLKTEMNERFDVVDLEMNAVKGFVMENRINIRKLGRNLTEQIANNTESIEELKLSH